MTITTDDVKQKVFMVLDADPIREDSKFKSLQAATSCYIEIDKKSINMYKNLNQSSDIMIVLKPNAMFYSCKFQGLLRGNFTEKDTVTMKDPILHSRSLAKSVTQPGGSLSLLVPRACPGSPGKMLVAQSRALLLSHQHPVQRQG